MVRHHSSEIRDSGKPSKILKNLMIVFALCATSFFFVHKKYAKV